MRIHNNFTGGNICVKKQRLNNFYLENELRDTVGDWFYWAFCVENAENKEINFHFDKNRIGYWGPAVSHDLKEWHWLDECEEKSFRYRFSVNEKKVYFAHHMLYHPERFIDFARLKEFEITELCKSRNGRSVPCLNLGNGEISVILTARHHACESTGNYVLEGVLEEFSRDFPDNIRILCVPFVDLDGVIDGDQGKSRRPHDHNRDYIENPIYPEIRAIKKYCDKYGCNFGFDFHSPWHKGGENDSIFIVRNCLEKEILFDRFSAIFEKEITEKSMEYKKTNDHPPFTDWNQPSSSFGCVMNSRPECHLAFSLGSTYFGTSANKVSSERFIELGKSFGKAIKLFINDFKDR